MNSIDAALWSLQGKIDTNTTDITNNTTAITNTNNAFKAWLPIGTICLWVTQSSGAVPAGWAICDGRVVNRSDGAGQIGTPNLMGRFILADPNTGQVGGNYTGSVNSGAAGSHSHGGVTGDHVLTINEMPAHTHTFTRTAAGTVAAGTGGGSAWRNDPLVGDTSGSTGSGAAHNHSINADGSHQHVVTMTIVPNYFTAMYIMRI